ncbi:MULTISPECIES: toll/interleukin-1 receptor domain-containing protein [unclassified Leeuwenhoekiella]|uniref:toll/interleukin-1 receptor domain-containing protein n=1 Tax=unclassified Leeuwenhoekiella TaxID=2615029 RepID=UPI000C55E4CD|nr:MULTISPECIES: toll/interleukin-1 receptor domain-containing protein [unclassified Leeuwenhoekiella]MAW94518.1 hypothetical protein [Leeuwenhoekiella sp.]MBA81941.1 hypothetical protein [Leeuwenhoekiella sp.]
MKLFISYSRAQVEEVKDISEFLGYLDYSCWFDHKLGAGTEWWNEILKQIRECDIFLFVLSKESNQSQACMAELTYAEGLGKYMMGLRVDDLSSSFMPPVLKDNNLTSYRPDDPKRKNLLVKSLRELEQTKPYVHDKGHYDQVPTPPMPISGLSKLHSMVRKRENLTMEEQKDLLFEIELLLDRKTEKPENIDIILNDFLNRNDVNHYIGKRIDALRNKLTDSDTEEPKTEASKSEPQNTGNPGTFTGYDAMLEDIITRLTPFESNPNALQAYRTQFHNPQNVYAKWHLDFMIENGQKVPLNASYDMAFGSNQLVQYFQNGKQTQTAGFYFNNEFMTIQFMNGAQNVFGFRCYGNRLFLTFYYNYVMFKVESYSRI